MPDAPPRWPDRIEDEQHLEELLSEPTPGVLAALSNLPGDILLPGVGGKMGPSLARMARRAADASGGKRRVVGVARFSNPNLRQQLERDGIETIACDLLDPVQVQALPEAANVIVMTGMKFGATGQQGMTWAMNAYLPALLAGKYRRSRLVAFSTGNVYGLTPVAGGGSLETDALHPHGEYAMSCLGRERMYEYFAQVHKIPTALLRLNYAQEMRYGVLLDIAQKVKTGQPIDLAMGHVNVIWQGDANAMALASLAHVATLPFVVNLAGPELLSVRRVAEEFGRLLDKPVLFTGSEAADAFLSNGQLGHRLFGYPRVPVQQIIHWLADWLRRDGPLLGKPTHFENRQGRY